MLGLGTQPAAAMGACDTCVHIQPGGRAEYVDRGRLPCVSCKGLGRRAHVLMYACMHRARVYVCGLAGVSFNGIFPVFRVFRVSRVLRLFRGQKVRAHVPAQAVTDGLAFESAGAGAPSACALRRFVDPRSLGRVWHPRHVRVHLRVDGPGVLLGPLGGDFEPIGSALCAALTPPLGNSTAWHVPDRYPRALAGIHECFDRRMQFTVP